MGSERVGAIRRNAEGAFCFAYDASYRRRTDAIPLSLSLPLAHEGDFVEGAARLFFANLLPEGRQRQLIARRFGLSENNDFELLAEIGGDCAGAVSVLPESVDPAADGGYRPISRMELRDAVADLPWHPLMAGESGLRLSLAGVQAKLPAWYRNGAFALPLGGPSTHILKPPIPDPHDRFAESVHNEAFVMRLARAAGLPVAAVSIVDLDPQVLLVERYDRHVDAEGTVQRVHQEDFCQALGVAPDRKYEAEGGPALPDCFGLVRREVIPPVAALNALIDWTVFNHLVGNADAHAKNLSLLLQPDGPELAPFYDLLCTAAWEELTAKSALRIGGEARPEWIQMRHWQRFAQACGVTERLVRDRLQGAAERMPAYVEVRSERRTASGSLRMTSR
ncbi:MAG: type II toxin-antitoxin system HipA family toxin [Halofilum sp. (in: g-proteobacteria)]|nr:type II toxin-antitoxin system HipA family toxin [Halofilum sp. (in: g-proteobacteria)]